MNQDSTRREHRGDTIKCCEYAFEVVNVIICKESVHEVEAPDVLEVDSVRKAKGKIKNSDESVRRAGACHR